MMLAAHIYDSSIMIVLLITIMNYLMYVESDRDGAHYP